MNRRLLFKTLVGTGCAASLGLHASVPAPKKLKVAKLVVNPDYEKAEYEEVLIFSPGYESPHAHPAPRFNLNKKTGEKEYVPYYKLIEA